MSERTKKILVIVAFVLSVIGIATALYFTFFRAAPPEATVTPGETETGGGLPTSGTAGERPPVTTGGGNALPPSSPVANGGLTSTTALTQGAVENATLSANGASVNFYNPADGKFYTVDKDGNLVLLSDAEFPNVESVSWNGDANKAVMEFPDGTNIVYDFATEKQTTLPKHWEDFQFSPTTDSIEAKSMGVDPNNRWLVTTNADGSNVQAFQALGENADKVTVAWSPNNQVVAFSDTADSLSGGLDRKMILPIGLNGENYRGLTVEGLGFLANWSPNGTQILYSVAGSYSDNKPLLWLVDGTPATMGDDRHSLGINTWADKCTWHTVTTIYCAVPQNLPNNSGLQRSLYEDYPDSVYKIEASTGKVTLVAIPDTEIAMASLSVSSDGTLLYFIDTDDGTLRSMRLK